jgi:hypothetical protein
MPLRLDLLGEDGNCVGCHMPFDDSRGHGYAVYRSTVIVTGRRTAIQQTRASYAALLAAAKACPP